MGMGDGDYWSSSIDSDDDDLDSWGYNAWGGNHTARYSPEEIFERLSEATEEANCLLEEYQYAYKHLTKAVHPEHSREASCDYREAYRRYNDALGRKVYWKRQLDRII